MNKSFIVLLLLFFCACTKKLINNEYVNYYVYVINDVFDVIVKCGLYNEEDILKHIENSLLKSDINIILLELNDEQGDLRKLIDKNNLFPELNFRYKKGITNVLNKRDRKVKINYFQFKEIIIIDKVEYQGQVKIDVVPSNINNLAKDFRLSLVFFLPISSDDRDLLLKNTR